MQLKLPLSIPLVALLLPFTSTQASSPFHLYGQLNGGYFSATPHGSTTSTKTGTQFHLGLAGAYQFPASDWSLLLGITYFNQSVSYRNNAQRIDIKTNTNAFAIELSPLYSLNDRWRLGPIIQALIGTDLSFPRPFHPTGTAILGGVQGQYGKAEGSILPFAQVQTDITVGSQTILLAMAGVRVKIPVFEGSGQEDATVEESHPVQKAAAKPAAKPSPRPVAKVSPKPTPTPVPTPTPAEPEAQAANETPSAPVSAPRALTIVLDSQLVNFLEDGTALSPESAIFLNKVGKFLSRQGKDWERLEIVGHIQEPKPKKSSKKIAQARAVAVEEALTDGGAPEFRLKSHAKVISSREEDSWIELRLKGIADSEEFQDEFEKIKQKR